MYKPCTWYITLFRRSGEQAGGGRIGASDCELGDRVAFEQRRNEHRGSLGRHLTQQVSGVVDSEVRRTAFAQSSPRRDQVAAPVQSISRYIAIPREQKTNKQDTLLLPILTDFKRV